MNIVQDIATLLQNFIGLVINWINKQNLFSKITLLGFAPFITVLSAFYNAFTDPNGAINTFFIWVGSFVIDWLPSTPDNLKLTNILYNFSTAYPSIGWGPVFAIVNGLLPILTIFILLKLIKFIPFF